MLRLSRCFRLLFFFFPQRRCSKSLLSRVGRKENGLEGDRSSPPPICWLMQLSHEGSFFVQLRRSTSVRRRQARVMQRMYCMYKLLCTDMPFGGEGSNELFIVAYEHDNANWTEYFFAKVPKSAQKLFTVFTAACCCSLTIWWPRYLQAGLFQF